MAAPRLPHFDRRLDRHTRRNLCCESSPALRRTRTGYRCTTLTKLPLAFSGGRRLNSDGNQPGVDVFLAVDARRELCNLTVHTRLLQYSDGNRDRTVAKSTLEATSPFVTAEEAKPTSRTLAGPTVLGGCKNAAAELPNRIPPCFSSDSPKSGRKRLRGGVIRRSIKPHNLRLKDYFRPYQTDRKIWLVEHEIEGRATIRYSEGGIVWKRTAD
jgi:hypothetical protein